ncbi:MAG: NADH-quinone oxidoreductase subunit NuoE [Pseudomonadales bacterium]
MVELISSLSNEELAAIDAELAHVPYKSAAAIDALKIVQSFRGWVSDESLKAIAHYLEMSAAELEGIATFYNLIYRQPVGDKVILFCGSVSCWIKGCDGLRSQITELLGVREGETTADNKYTLLPVTCLGACDKAPVMMVGEDLHEDLDRQKIQKIFASSAGGES